jgi:hypothetical protein
LAAKSKIILEVFDTNVEFLQALFEFLGHKGLLRMVSGFQVQGSGLMDSKSILYF